MEQDRQIWELRDIPTGLLARLDVIVAEARTNQYNEATFKIRHTDIVRDVDIGNGELWRLRDVLRRYVMEKFEGFKLSINSRGDDTVLEDIPEDIRDALRYLDGNRPGTGKRVHSANGRTVADIHFKKIAARAWHATQAKLPVHLRKSDDSHDAFITVATRGEKTKTQAERIDELSTMDEGGIIKCVQVQLKKIFGKKLKAVFGIRRVISHPGIRFAPPPDPPRAAAAVDIRRVA